MTKRSMILLCALSIETSGQAATVLQVEVANHVFYGPDGQDWLIVAD